MALSAPPPGASNKKIRGGTPKDYGYIPNPSGLSTSAVVKAWSNGSSTPPSRPPSGLCKFTFFNGEKLTGSVACDFIPALKALDSILEKHNYHPVEKAGIWGFCHRRIRGSSNVWSAHSAGTAIDLNVNLGNGYVKTFETDMPVPMVNEILSLRTNNGKAVFAWGGHYGSTYGKDRPSSRKDSMHWSCICGPEDIKTGIVGAAPPKPAYTLDSVVEAVKKIYIKVLGRPADQGAIEYHGGNLLMGKQTEAGLAAELAASAEGKAHAAKGGTQSTTSPPAASTPTPSKDSPMTPAELAAAREDMHYTIQLDFKLGAGRWMNLDEQHAWRSALWQATNPLTLDSLVKFRQGFMNQVSGGKINTKW